MLLGSIPEEERRVLDQRRSWVTRMLQRKAFAGSMWTLRDGSLLWVPKMRATGLGSVCMLISYQRWRNMIQDETIFIRFNWPTYDHFLSSLPKGISLCRSWRGLWAQIPEPSTVVSGEIIHHKATVYSLCNKKVLHKKTNYCNCFIHQKSLNDRTINGHMNSW